MPESLGILPYCSLYEPKLVVLILASSFLLMLTYGAIGCFKLTRSFARRVPYHHWLAATFALCGLSHGARIVSMYTQNYWWEAGFLALAALVSIPTVVGVCAVQKMWQRADDEIGA